MEGQSAQSENIVVKLNKKAKYTLSSLAKRVFFYAIFLKKFQLYLKVLMKIRRVSVVTESFRKSALSFSYNCDKLNSIERKWYDD